MTTPARLKGMPEPKTRLGDIYPSHPRSSLKPKCSRCGTEIRTRKPAFRVECWCVNVFEWLPDAPPVSPTDPAYATLGPEIRIRAILKGLGGVLEHLNGLHAQIKAIKGAHAAGWKATMARRQRNRTPDIITVPRKTSSPVIYNARLWLRRAKRRVVAPFGFCGKCARPHAVWDTWREPLADGSMGPSRCGFCRSDSAVQMDENRKLGYLDFAVTHLARLWYVNRKTPRQYMLE